MKRVVKPLSIVLIMISIFLFPTQECFAESSALPYFTLTNKSISNGKSSMRKFIPVGKNEVLKVTAINKSDSYVTLYLVNLAGERVKDVMTLLPGDETAKIKTVEVPIDKGIYFLKLRGANNVWNGRYRATGNVITFARTKRLRGFF